MCITSKTYWNCLQVNFIAVFSMHKRSRSVTWWQNYVTTERIAESFCWFESQRVELSVGAFKCCLLFSFKDDSVKMRTVVKERIHTVTKYDLGKRIQLVLRIISWTGSFSQRKPDPKYMTSCYIPERALRCRKQSCRLQRLQPLHQAWFLPFKSLL